MGLLDILRGIADQADIIPGFDPNKDKQGLLSQLFSGGGQQYGQTPPIVPPGMQSSPQARLDQILDTADQRFSQAAQSPGGVLPKQPQAPGRGFGAPGGPLHANYVERQPAMQRAPLPKDFTTPLNPLDVMNPFKDTRNIRANDQARLDNARAQFAGQQQSQAAEAQKRQLLNRLTAGGYNPQQINQIMAAQMMNADKTGESLASNFEGFTLNEGDTRHNFGQEGIKNDRTAAPLDPMDAQLRQQNADASTMQADAAMLRARNPSPGVVVNTGDTAAGQRPIVDKPEKGYQMTWDADAGTYRQEVVPGSSQAREEEMLNSKAFQALQANNEQFGAIMSNIDAADELIGTFTAGAGSYLEGIRGTPAKDLAARMETVKANIGFDKLNEMRQTSPTGGALGQVTERELNFLQSVRGSLDSGQSPEQLRETLNEVKASLQRLQEVREIAFKLEQQSPGEGQIASSDPFTNDDLPPGFEIVQ